MSETRVMTPEFRASYVNVWEPRKADDDADPKYGVSMLFKKKEKLGPMRAAALAAAKQKWGDKAQMMIKTGKLKMPFRDGDEEREDDPAYKGVMFMNGNSKRKPGVVDSDAVPILDHDEFYSGCYARATVNFYPFEVKGNRGVAVGLNNIQKLRDGERLDGSVKAEDDFEPVDVPGTEEDDDRF